MGKYRREYYWAHRERINTLARAYRAVNGSRLRAAERNRKAVKKAYIDSLRASGCVDCGIKNLSVLDFDHVNGKHVDVGQMGNYSYAMIDAEIAKCEVRCANCHRLVTAQRRRVG